LPILVHIKNAFDIFFSPELAVCWGTLLIPVDLVEVEGLSSWLGFWWGRWPVDGPRGFSSLCPEIKISTNQNLDKFYKHNKYSPFISEMFYKTQNFK
jgi:hypothetical protein